jgi:hypothetical protein
MSTVTKTSYPKASYSTSLRYTFIHIPKCAGTSVHCALTQLHEQFGFARDPVRYHKHATACEVRDKLADHWRESLVFAFVRNPWDLMVSSYHWWIHCAGRYPSLARDAAEVAALNGFGEFLISPHGSEMINERRGRDMLEWICDGDDVIVDFVGRYERLDEDWERLCEMLQVPPVPLTHENRVSRAHYSTFYDDESRQRVAKRFARSIQTFGYEF